MCSAIKNWQAVAFAALLLTTFAFATNTSTDQYAACLSSVLRGQLTQAERMVNQALINPNIADRARFRLLKDLINHLSETGHQLDQSCCTSFIPEVDPPKPPPVG